MRRNIEIIINPCPKNKIDLLEKFLLLWSDSALSKTLDTRYGLISTEYYLEKIKKKGNWKYGFENNEISVIHGDNRSYEFYHLIIKEKIKDSINYPQNWAKFLCNEPGFLFSRISDDEYEYWQNADRITEYENKKRKYNQQDLISNNLPYPLEEKIIDISKNPGRRIFKNGYIEAIGYEMWLSNRMFNFIGGFSIENLKTAGWKVDISRNGITHLSVSPVDLSEEGSFEKQQALRTSLFELKQCGKN